MRTAALATVFILLLQLPASAQNPTREDLDALKSSIDKLTQAVDALSKRKKPPFALDYLSCPNVAPGPCAQSFCKYLGYDRFGYALAFMGTYDGKIVQNLPPNQQYHWVRNLVCSD